MKQLTIKEDLNKKQRSLFSNCMFMLNRECPIYSLQYLILSFGGNFVLDDENKSVRITHHVIDRPLLGKLDTTREYVQPQWIIDSLNNLHLLPPNPYRPGVPPPPHLSPFVDNAKEGYIPNRQKEINQLKGDVVEDIDEEEESEVEAVPVETKNNKTAPAVPVKQSNKGDADSSSEDEDSEAEVQK